MHRRSALAFFCVLIVLALASCVPAADFGVFIGVNLIDSSHAADFTLWTADQGSIYMNVEAVAGQSYTDGSQAYRLEIKNLLPNGDFDASTVGSADPSWITSVITGSSSVVNGAIKGNTLSFSLPNAELLSYDLKTGLQDGFVAGGTYLVSFDYKLDPETLLPLSYNNGSSDYQTWSVTSGTAFPKPGEEEADFFAHQSIDYFSINTISTGVALTGYLDNVRVARIDNTDGITCEIPFSLQGRPDLIPGTYRFSVYVKADPAAGAANRFPAAGVSISVDGFPESGVTSVEPAVAHPTDSGADWSSWTKVSGDFTETWIPNHSAPGTPILRLTIAATDMSGGSRTRDVGSLLIARPMLELVP